MTAALRLRKINHIRPVIYELREEPMTLLGGAIGIPSNGLRLLSRLGLYDAMASRGAQTPSVILHSTKGSIVGEMDMIGWSEKHTGFGYLRIKRTDVMEVLLEAAERDNISISYGMALEDVFLFSNLLHSKNLTPDSAISIYETRRRRRVEEMLKTAETRVSVRKKTFRQFARMEASMAHV